MEAVEVAGVDMEGVGAAVAFFRVFDGNVEGFTGSAVVADGVHTVALVVDLVVASGIEGSGRSQGIGAVCIEDTVGEGAVLIVGAIYIAGFSLNGVVFGVELQVKGIDRGATGGSVGKGDIGYGIGGEGESVIVVREADKGTVNPFVVLAADIGKGGVVLDAGEVGHLDGGDAIASTDGSGEDVVVDVAVGDGVATPEVEATGIGDADRGDAAGVAVAGHDGDIEDAGAAAGGSGGGGHRIGSIVGSMGDGAGGDNGVNPRGQIIFGEEGVASNNLDRVGHQAAESRDREMNDTVATVGSGKGFVVHIEVTDGVGAPEVEASGSDGNRVFYSSFGERNVDADQTVATAHGL